MDMLSFSSSKVIFNIKSEIKKYINIIVYVNWQTCSKETNSQSGRAKRSRIGTEFPRLQHIPHPRPPPQHTKTG